MRPVSFPNSLQTADFILSWFNQMTTNLELEETRHVDQSDPFNWFNAVPGNMKDCEGRKTNMRDIMNKERMLVVIWIRVELLITRLYTFHLVIDLHLSPIAFDTQLLPWSCTIYWSLLWISIKFPSCQSSTIAQGKALPLLMATWNCSILLL